MNTPTNQRVAVATPETASVQPAPAKPAHTPCNLCGSKNGWAYGNELFAKLQSERDDLLRQVKHWQDDHARLSKLFAKTFQSNRELLAALKLSYSKMLCDQPIVDAAIANAEGSKQ